MAFSIYNYIADYLETNSKSLQNMSHVEVANHMISNDSYLSGKYSNRIKTLTRALCDLRKKDNIVIAQDDAVKEIKTSYDVINGNYHFYPIKGEFQLPIELVDDLFYEFSRHGLDLSSTEVINKHNLQPHQWHAVKSALRLYKASNVFSPHTIKNLSPEALKTAIREKMDIRVNTVGFRVETEYNQSIIRKYNEIIKKDAIKHLESQTLVNELYDLIPKAEIKPLKIVVEQKQHKVINVVLSDLHFGAANPASNHLPDFNVQIIRDLFQKEVIPTINSYGASEVNILGVGDWIETATGFNHPDSWKGIQEGYYGAKVITECYKFLVEVVSQIHNVKKIIGVSGNHDRMTPSRDHDREGFCAEIIFEFLKLTYNKSDIEIIYDSKLTHVVLDNICYIVSHGHEKYTDNGAQLVLKYGSQKHYNVLLSGHWHERRIKGDNEFFRQIVCPSIFMGNNYSQSLGYSTVPGYLILFNKGNGKLAVHDYSL